MRTIILIFTLLIAFLLFFNGCIVNIVGDVQTRQCLVSTEPSLIKLIAVGILGVYEIVVRLVPSVGDYSAVSWIIRILKKVSDTLNVMK
jgi:hypothetical protein